MPAMLHSTQPFVSSRSSPLFKCPQKIHTISFLSILPLLKSCISYMISLLANPSRLPFCFMRLTTQHTIKFSYCCSISFPSNVSSLDSSFLKNANICLFLWIVLYLVSRQKSTAYTSLSIKLFQKVFITYDNPFLYFCENFLDIDMVILALVPVFIVLVFQVFAYPALAVVPL